MSPRARASVPRVVHGDDLLYDFFQNALADSDPAFVGVPQLLLQTMGVWMPLRVYASWPVLRPYVVRDPSCRGKRAAGLPDQWGSPDAHGYLRDDNSLIKGLPRALLISGPRTRRLSGARLGTEFVAAHIWRTVSGTSTLASRIPALNSFVPNLVWLPRQVAKLTDREGGIVQEMAQGLSWAIYRDAPVEAHLRDVVDECWGLLPKPSRELRPFSHEELNWFVATDAFLLQRAERLASVLDALQRVRSGLPLEGRVITSRYTAGLGAVEPAAVEALIEALRRYVPPES